MGNNSSSMASIKINFEDIQYCIKNREKYILINTLTALEQDCLIINTLPYNKEEDLINSLIQSGKLSANIVIYGKNCNDINVYNKYKQLITLGFKNIKIYSGGLFEWLLLQDIYGANEFPTTKKELDLLKFKPAKLLNVPQLEYYG
jgi:hypothetical protein